MSDPVRLSAGDYELDVEPAFGGRITLFRYRGLDLFVPVGPGPRDLNAGASAGCYPLVPWSNRIRDGRFGWDGRTVSLEATEAGTGNAIHGHGLRRAWELTGHGGQSLRMGYTHSRAAEGWPFDYVAEQVVALDEDGLSVSLAMDNRSGGPMPGGLGLHPYLPRSPELGLWFSAGSAWTPAEGKFPAGGEPVGEALSFAEPRPVVLGLDQGFGGWDGSAHAIWPDRGIGLSMTGGAALTHLILFTPEDRDFVCLEPVTHAIDAINLDAAGVGGTGHRRLAADERLVITVRFSAAVI